MKKRMVQEDLYVLQEEHWIDVQNLLMLFDHLYQIKQKIIINISLYAHPVGISMIIDLTTSEIYLT